MECPCKEQHEIPGPVARLIEKYGELTRVRVAGSTWMVPRLFIAMHGLKAVELPALAERYGFEKCVPEPGDTNRDATTFGGS